MFVHFLLMGALLAPNVVHSSPGTTEPPIPETTTLDSVQPGAQSTEPDIAVLANLIGAVESDTVGGYNAANAGSAMDLGRNGLIVISGMTCEQITIGQIKAWQRRGLLYAVGRYQMIPSTLRAAVKWAGLKDSDKFSQENQDKLLVALLRHKRPGVWDYLTRKGASMHAAMMELAREWAGIPTPQGSSYYGYGNRSHTSVEQVRQALRLAKAW